MKRDELNRLVADFLKKGGKIKKIPEGVSGLKPAKDQESK